jgi:hypothetical protein
LGELQRGQGWVRMPAPEWCPRRSRFFIFEVRRFGTAMMSSNRFGGGATGARPRVQVGPAAGAKACTVVPAEQQVGLGREGKLLAHDKPHIHGGRAIGEEIEIGVVHRVGIGAEHGRVHRHVHLVEHLRQAAAALAADHAVEIASPQVFSYTGGLKLPMYHHRSHQIEPQALEGRIVRRKLSLGANGASLEVPDIHAQHSPLT